MRSLRVTLLPSHPVILPIAYNELLQGLLYSCWRENIPDLHDAGFGDRGEMRLFTFGPLKGKLGVDAKRKTIQLEGPVSFEVRSPVEDLLDELASQLAMRGTARVGAHELQIVNLEAIDRLLFPRQARIKALSPIVVQRKLEDGKTEPLCPTDDGWVGLIRANAANKASAFGLDAQMAEELQVVPLVETLHKRVTRFKKTHVTGWTGEFVIACDPQLLSALYSCGLGPKNSQGFGMFEIEDRRIS